MFYCFLFLILRYFYAQSFVLFLPESGKLSSRVEFLKRKLFGFYVD